MKYTQNPILNNSGEIKIWTLEINSSLKIKYIIIIIVLMTDKQIIIIIIKEGNNIFHNLK